jgi:hypothetical protein
LTKVTRALTLEKFGSRAVQSLERTLSTLRSNVLLMLDRFSSHFHKPASTTVFVVFVDWIWCINLFISPLLYNNRNKSNNKTKDNTDFVLLLWYIGLSLKEIEIKKEVHIYRINFARKIYTLHVQQSLHTAA